MSNLIFPVQLLLLELLIFLKQYYSLKHDNCTDYFTTFLSLNDVFRSMLKHYTYHSLTCRCKTVVIECGYKLTLCTQLTWAVKLLPSRSKIQHCQSSVQTKRCNIYARMESANRSPKLQNITMKIMMLKKAPKAVHGN